MALAFLLDENISHVVGREIHIKRPDIQITSVHVWRNGALHGMSDMRLLRAAAEDGLTLVTYDQKTIPPLLSEWGMTGENHGGILFVDERTVKEGDVGGLVRALIEHWDLKNAQNWVNAIDFLRPRQGTYL